MKKNEIKVGTNGVKYQLIKRIGKGGQAAVWKVQDIENKKYYAYKEYKHNTNNIKANIVDLIKIGKFKNKNDEPLEEVVLPITTVECDGDSFGYIMELVDLKDFTTVPKAWCGKYPSCEAICKIVQNFAQVFETLHIKYGMCYKDVNEGNIFFNPKSGEIKIIDNDNIGYANKPTIKGTPGYRAPEVVLGDLPDHNSDRFSFAVFVFRLLTGGYPFDGAYTNNYCNKNDLTVYDAEKVVYGEKAVFVWHPSNKINCIENNPKKQGQVNRWNILPNSIKDMFINTFATNLSKDRKAERTTDVDWKEKFDDIEKNLIKCPNCGKITFSESGICFECLAELKGQSTNKTSTVHIPIMPMTSITSELSHKHKVIMKVLSAGEVKREMEVYVSDVISADKVSKNLPLGNLFKILYNKKEKKLGIKNLSNASWTIIHADKTKETCKTGQVQALEKDMMIRIIPKTAQLNIMELK